MESREPTVHRPEEPLCIGPGPFRPNVAALILRQATEGPEILLGERQDMPGAWQWPQGGMDPGESPETALFREVEEEIGVAEIDILHRFPFVLRYRFPQRLSKRFSPCIGQEQIYFVVGLRHGARPDLQRATSDEFRALRWMPLGDCANAMVWFKRPVGTAALDHVCSMLPELHIPIMA